MVSGCQIFPTAENYPTKTVVDADISFPQNTREMGWSRGSVQTLLAEFTVLIRPSDWICGCNRTKKHILPEDSATVLDPGLWHNIVRGAVNHSWISA
jgi:hypothetical protein